MEEAKEKVVVARKVPKRRKGKRLAKRAVKREAKPGLTKNGKRRGRPPGKGKKKGKPVKVRAVRSKVTFEHVKAVSASPLELVDQLRRSLENYGHLGFATDGELLAELMRRRAK